MVVIGARPDRPRTAKRWTPVRASGCIMHPKPPPTHPRCAAPTRLFPIPAKPARPPVLTPQRIFS
eukprot:5506880-Prymnesium_polylepis.2